jgi:hypothetical protein
MNMPIAINHRLLPPATGPYTIMVSGRSYSCAIGSSIDVPEFAILLANGWMFAAAGGVGTTAARPVLTSSQKGTQYHDNTLGFNITWDGKTWRNPTNGVAV